MKHAFILFTFFTIVFFSQSYAQVNSAWETPLRFNGAANGTDAPTSIVVDGVGNVFVGGSTQQSGSTDKDWLIIKYNVNGEELWQKQFPNDGDDYLLAMKIDALGNIYATGRYCFPSQGGRQANYYKIGRAHV